MKWLILGIALIIWNYVISGQDIVFPDDEEISHISGNNPVVIMHMSINVTRQETDLYSITKMKQVLFIFLL